MSDHLVTLPSGVRLGTSAAGDPLAGRLVLLCLPTPGAGMFDPDPEVTNRWGVHLVAVDRPGYGATPAAVGDPRPAHSAAAGGGASLGDRADELADYLLLARQTSRGARAAADEPAGVVGWGTGALVALALGTRHPELVDRIAVVHPPAPTEAGVDLAADPAPRSPFGLRDLGIDPADPVLERAGLRNRLERMLATAAEQGDAGVRIDRAALPDGTATHARGAHDDSGRILRIDTGGPLAIVSAWPRILEHVAPDHGGLPEGIRRGGG